MKDAIRRRALQLGASRCGFAVAEPVDSEAAALHAAWIADGKHGTMEYCAKYSDVRNDPRLLLAGAQTVIACAFPYLPGNSNPRIAAYALGQDYHYVIKHRLSQLGSFITEAYGGETRVLVDTAPMRERYWAQKAGIGFIGINNQLIVPGEGSYFFLGELLWTGSVEPDEPCREDCGHCMACVKACPGHALDGNGGCDARKCVSYLTIEHRGDLPEGANLAGMLYGCDICQKACPHNAYARCTDMPEFQPNPELLALDVETLHAMTPSHYKRLTAHSAMRRAPLSQLLRNAK